MRVKRSPVKKRRCLARRSALSEISAKFFDDLENENPNYAILGTDIKSTHNNYLYDYVLTNYTIEKCERSYCIYKLKN